MKRERDGRASLVTLKELYKPGRISSYKPSTVQSEGTYYNTCVHVTRTVTTASRGEATIPPDRVWPHLLKGGGHQRRKWTPTLAITTTPHPMAGLLLIDGEDFLLVSQGKARAQRYTCNTTPFIIGLTSNCHEHTIETISLVPRSLPRFQCCTQKRGRAWEAKSRERDCAMALHTKHRTVHEPYW